VSKASDPCPAPGSAPPSNEHASNDHHVRIPWLTDGLSQGDDADDNEDVLNLGGDDWLNSPITSGSDPSSWDPIDISENR
jgi:hypothetical protein